MWPASGEQNVFASEETVDHIVSGCEILAKTEYISRHNNAAAYLHWSIYKDHDLEITDKWYEQEPETVCTVALCNNRRTL